MTKRRKPPKPPKVTIDIDAVRQLKQHSKATGEDGQAVIVTMKDIDLVVPNARGKSFSGTLLNVTHVDNRPGDLTHAGWMINVRGPLQHQMHGQSGKQSVIYSFHDCLIERVEVAGGEDVEETDAESDR